MNNNSKKSSTSNIGYYIVAGIFMLGLILIIFYRSFLKKPKNEQNILTGPSKFNELFYKEVENNIDLIPGKGYGFTLIWEMNIPNQMENNMFNSTFNRLKPIIRFGDSPQIYYHPKHGYLSIIVKYTDNPFYSNYPEIKIKNIKLQKWQKYVLVFNDRNINLYIDGKLVSANTIMNVPEIDTNNLIQLGEINNNFLGVIKNMRTIAYPIDNKMISNL